MLIHRCVKQICKSGFKRGGQICFECPLLAVIALHSSNRNMITSGNTFTILSWRIILEWPLMILFHFQDCHDFQKKKILSKFPIEIFVKKIELAKGESGHKRRRGEASES